MMRLCFSILSWMFSLEWFSFKVNFLLLFWFLYLFFGPKTMTKTEELLDRLMLEINQLLIAWYIKEEAISSLKYLHRYKLRNIEKNLRSFREYLVFLNTQNTEKIRKLCPWDEKKSTKELLSDLYYFFLPEKSISKQTEKAYLQKISNHKYELLTLVQGIKWILVLSIDEFCNASATRMSIHQMLMKTTGGSCL